MLMICDLNRNAFFHLKISTAKNFVIRILGMLKLCFIIWFYCTRFRAITRLPSLAWRFETCICHYDLHSRAMYSVRLLAHRARFAGRAHIRRIFSPAFTLQTDWDGRLEHMRALGLGDDYEWIAAVQKKFAAGGSGQCHRCRRGAWWEI